MTEYIEVNKPSVNEVIATFAASFEPLEAGSDEEYAFLSVLPVPADLQPTEKPFNEITTVKEFTRGALGEAFIELGDSPKMEKLKLKIKKTLPSGVQKLTSAQVNSKMPKEEIIEAPIKVGK